VKDVLKKKYTLILTFFSHLSSHLIIFFIKNFIKWFVWSKEKQTQAEKKAIKS
jgi:nicotinamide riboside transporter PnuC